MKPTKDDVLSSYAKLVAHAKTHKDSKGNGNADPEGVAFHGLRSNIHESLQAANPPPPPHPDDEGDPELHHARQKAHFKKLWKEADAIVAAAGVTEKGLVS